MMKNGNRRELVEALILVVLFTALAFVSCASASTTYTVCQNGCNYTSIQAAVDAAEPGDTIEVHSGTYYENVNVTKQLILKGNDTGSGKPVVNGGGNGSVITLSADGITLDRFTVTNASDDAGVNVTANESTITGTNASNNNYGIRLHYSCNNTITGNTANYNNYGIYLYHSGNNSIKSNTFVHDGLFVYYSYQNTVAENTVNVKPLVYLEDASDTVVTDAGQVILVNCTNITVEDLELSNTCIGVMLWRTVDSLISNNTVSNNNRYGINLYDSSNDNSITGNNVSSNNRQGIVLDSNSNNNTITGNYALDNGNNGILLTDSCNHNAIKGNNVCNNSYNGIFLDSAGINNISGNNVSNNGEYGIFLRNSSNNNSVYDNTVCNNSYNGIILSLSCNHNTILCNTLCNNSYNGILLYRSSNNNTVTDNTACNNHYNGIFLSLFSNYNTISGNIVCNNSYSSGIFLNSSTNNILSGNTACNNAGEGIHLFFSNNNSITGNNASSNSNGIYLFTSSNNTMTGNNAGNNYNDGFYLTSSSSNNIKRNNVYNSNGGIYLDDSSDNNAITDNTFVNTGLFVHYSYQNTVAENTVNGKPLVYLEDASDTVVTEAGQVILVNCTNITVENQELSNTTVGIALLKTEDSIIANNTVNNNAKYGLSLEPFCANNTIYGNTACNNLYNGIFLSYSSNYNTITSNNVSNNLFNGIFLSLYSHHNTITGNYACKNYDNGISLDLFSINNLISGNYACKNYDNGIRLASSSNSNTITGNNASSSYNNGILSGTSYNNIISNNTLSSNRRNGIRLYASDNNTITGNNVSSSSNTSYGIEFEISHGNKIYLNNFINKTNNVLSYNSTSIWNSPEELSYSFKSGTHTNYMGNYWSDYKDNYPDAGEKIAGCGIWNTPYSVDGDGDTDNYPLVEPEGNYIIETGGRNHFDTGSPANPYPSISGTYNGTIKPEQTITVSRLYTYPCKGTGGHTESIRLWNSTFNVTTTWKGYQSNWQNIAFDDSFTLVKDKIYYYTIRTGSYPQVIHNQTFTNEYGTINCTKFTEVNGRVYYDWIPAIKLLP
ncbi:MAG: NosD domain-containing protein [Halobacteriota archaeon]